jgi:hypothetical protein
MDNEIKDEAKSALLDYKVNGSTDTALQTTVENHYNNIVKPMLGDKAEIKVSQRIVADRPERSGKKNELSATQWGLLETADLATLLAPTERRIRSNFESEPEAHLQTKGALEVYKGRKPTETRIPVAFWRAKEAGDKLYDGFSREAILARNAHFELETSLRTAATNAVIGLQELIELQRIYGTLDRSIDSSAILADGSLSEQDKISRLWAQYREEVVDKYESQAISVTDRLFGKGNQLPHYLSNVDAKEPKLRKHLRRNKRKTELEKVIPANRIQANEAAWEEVIADQRLRAAKYGLMVGILSHMRESYSDTKYFVGGETPPKSKNGNDLHRKDLAIMYGLPESTGWPTIKGAVEASTNMTRNRRSRVR